MLTYFSCFSILSLSIVMHRIPSTNANFSAAGKNKNTSLRQRAEHRRVALISRDGSWLERRKKKQERLEKASCDCCQLFILWEKGREQIVLVPFSIFAYCLASLLPPSCSRDVPPPQHGRLDR